MPIWDYQCDTCSHIWESIEIWVSHAPKECPNCKGTEFKKVLGMPIVRTDPDTVKRNLPDPMPPLEELRGKGTEGYKDKPYADTQLKNYNRQKDKHGNIIWTEKRKTHVDMGRKK